MSQDTWELVKSREIEEIELQLALQCAPLIAGLKISNLLNIHKKEFPKMKEIVTNSHISWYVLLETKDKITVLLYHQKSLEDYLGQENVTELLKKMGYENFSLQAILEAFCLRYRQYMVHSRDFPHEMGLLLGYPVEDVEGFIRHKGADFLCMGYWKVYENRDRKLKIFESFENAKENLIQLLSVGMSMGDILQRKLIPD